MDNRVVTYVVRSLHEIAASSVFCFRYRTWPASMVLYDVRLTGVSIRGRRKH